jgi:hypothetical protein
MRRRKALVGRARTSRPSPFSSPGYEFRGERGKVWNRAKRAIREFPFSTQVVDEAVDGGWARRGFAAACLRQGSPFAGSILITSAPALTISRVAYGP